MNGKSRDMDYKFAIKVLSSAKVDIPAMHGNPKNYGYHNQEFYDIARNMAIQALKEKYEKVKIDATDKDFGAILTCAVRYALGRQTYIVGLVADYIKPLLSEISTKTLAVMERDIETAYSYGDEKIDKPVWMDLLNAIKREKLRRETNV